MTVSECPKCGSEATLDSYDIDGVESVQEECTVCDWYAIY